MTNHPSPAAAASQCDLIPAGLQESRGEWVGMLTLHHLSGAMAVHSRISELRGRGHQIDQKSRKVGRMIHSSYRLIPESTPDLTSQP
jgi:hypothetical protein